MEDRIYIIIAKVLHGEASDAERREVDAWAAEDAMHQKELADMQTAWLEADSLFETPQFNTAVAWEKVSSRIRQPIPEAAAPKRAKTIAFPAWAKYSSALAAMLVIAVLLWKPFGTSNIEIASADRDQRIGLPDGSVISLRKGSSFSYPRKFASNERRVKLEGEAYFEVARNEAQPFVIDAQPVDVKVLGTTFNVRSYRGRADVAVISGRVQVSAQGNTQKAVVLTKGRKAHFENGLLQEGEAGGYESLWVSGELTFNNQPLSKVVSVIAAVKDTAIQLDAALNPALQSQLVTVSFRNQSLEDMLTELCLITGYRWEKRGASYLVLPK